MDAAYAWTLIYDAKALDDRWRNAREG